MGTCISVYFYIADSAIILVKNLRYLRGILVRLYAAMTNKGSYVWQSKLMNNFKLHKEQIFIKTTKMTVYYSILLTTWLWRSDNLICQSKYGNELSGKGVLKKCMW